MSDARLAAFLSPLAPEIFHSVQHRHEIWREDPFDVDSLHADARAVFSRLLSRATTPPGLPSGRILLILGESGSGKTHLLRAFRNQVHGEGLGYVGYMQMTTATQNYGRYMLSNLIDSLDQPYNELLSPTTSGLMRLAQAVASRCPAPVAARLSDEDADVHAAVLEGADAIVRRYDVDLDLVRALLYLSRDDALIKSRAFTIWTGVMGVSLVVGLVAIYAGTLGWGASLLLLYAATGRWLPRATPPGPREKEHARPA